MLWFAKVLVEWRLIPQMSKVILSKKKLKPIEFWDLDKHECISGVSPAWPNLASICVIPQGGFRARIERTTRENEVSQFYQSLVHDWWSSFRRNPKRDSRNMLWAAQQLCSSQFCLYWDLHLLFRGTKLAQSKEACPNFGYVRLLGSMNRGVQLSW